MDAEAGRWLLCAWRSAAHVHLGYGSFAQYIERLSDTNPEVMLALFDVGFNLGATRLRTQ